MKTTRTSTSRLTVGLLLLVLALLVPTGAASAERVAAGNTGWLWANPFPQGSDLRQVAVRDGRWWAGGSGGTLIRSDDAGTSWSSVRTGLLDDVRRIVPISRDQVVFAGSCALRRSDDGGATVRRLAWTPSDGSCPAQITAISFPTAGDGYLLLSNADLYATHDGGANWFRPLGAAPTVPACAERPVRDLVFNAPTVGVLSCGELILRSEDGGQSWQEAGAGLPGSGFRFDFISAAHGFALAEAGGLVLRTFDGGATWAQASAAASGLGGGEVFDCVDGSRCVATLPGSGRMLISVDGGRTWGPSAEAQPSIRAVGIEGGTAIAVGDAGAIILSADNGHSWSPQTVNFAGPWTGVKAVGKKTYLLFGRSGAIAQTGTAGLTWKEVEPVGRRDLVDATAVGSRIYALDDRGRIDRSDNRETWKLAFRSKQRARAVHAWSRNHLLIAGPRGLRISKRAGRSAKAVRGSVAKLALSGIDAAGRATFAWGRSAIVVSSDKGRRWKRVRRPKKSKAIRALDMQSAKRGWLLDTAAELYRTSNGGRSWTRLETTGANQVRSMAFGDAKNGYLTDGSGRVLATADGGATWVRQYPFFDSLGKSPMLIAAPQRKWAMMVVKDTDRALITRTGGQMGKKSKLTLSTSAKRVSSGTIVRVTGKLSPATGVEQVSVLARVIDARPGTLWEAQEKTVSAGGSFTTSWLITQPTEFIARWSGTATHDGAAAKRRTILLRR